MSSLFFWHNVMQHQNSAIRSHSKHQSDHCVCVCVAQSRTLPPLLLPQTNKKRIHTQIERQAASSSRALRGLANRHITRQWQPLRHIHTRKYNSATAAATACTCRSGRNIHAKVKARGAFCSNSASIHSMHIHKTSLMAVVLCSRECASTAIRIYVCMLLLLLPCAYCYIYCGSLMYCTHTPAKSTPYWRAVLSVCLRLTLFLVLGAATRVAASLLSRIVRKQRTLVWQLPLIRFMQINAV